MANAYAIIEEDYTLDMDAVIKPLYHLSIAAQCYPIIQNLKPHSLQVRTYKQEDDLQYRYNMETEYALSHVGYTPTDTATPVITANLHYGYDELQRINDSKLPLDGRVDAVRQTFADAYDRICFTGSTVALDDIAVTSVDTTGTNSTAVTTAQNFTTNALSVSTFGATQGQIIDNLNTMSDPQALVVNPDVYKVIWPNKNANTDRRTFNELNDMMRDVNPASPGVLISKYLTATITRDHPGDYAVTAGTGNTALFNINPRNYRIHTSPIEVRSEPVSKLRGLHIQFVQRFRPVYIDAYGIYYEDAATIA